MKRHEKIYGIEMNEKHISDYKYDKMWGDICKYKWSLESIEDKKILKKILKTQKMEYNKTQKNKRKQINRKRCNKVELNIKECLGNKLIENKKVEANINKI